MFKIIYDLIIQSLQMNPEKIETIHSSKCGITKKVHSLSKSSIVYPKTIKLILQLRMEQYSEGILKGHQKLIKILKQHSNGYLSNAKVRVLMTEFI